MIRLCIGIDRPREQASKRLLRGFPHLLLLLLLLPLRLVPKAGRQQEDSVYIARAWSATQSFGGCVARTIRAPIV